MVVYVNGALLMSVFAIFAAGVTRLATSDVVKHVFINQLKCTGLFAASVCTAGSARQEAWMY